MKRQLPRKLLLAFLLSTAVLAQAQNQGPPGGGQKPNAKSQMNDARDGGDCRRGPPMDELTATLGLQANQREPLANLLKQRHEAMRRSHDEADRKADGIAAQSNAQIAKLLTPAQMSKFQEWEKTHRPPPPPRQGQGMGATQGGQNRGGPPPQGMGGGSERPGGPPQQGGGEHRGGPPPQQGDMRCPPPRDDGPPPDGDRRGGGRP